jgi:hypothetical protein
MGAARHPQDFSCLFILVRQYKQFDIHATISPLNHLTCPQTKFDTHFLKVSAGFELGTLGLSWLILHCTQLFKMLQMFIKFSFNSVEINCRGYFTERKFFIYLKVLLFILLK